MVSVEYNDNWFYFSYDYNPKYNKIIKEVAGFSNWGFDGKVKKWKVKPAVVIDVITAFKEQGENISECLNYINSIEFEEEEKTPDKLNIIERKNLIISFKYNPKIVSAIKELEYKKWHPNIKSWEISRKEAIKLNNKIKDIIECSELLKYTEVKKVTLMDYLHLTKKPFQHQVAASQFLLDKKKAILADEMGVGKTLSSILAANSIPGQKMIVCPSSLKLNWQKEIKEVDHKGHISIVDDSLIEADWVIISYTMLSKWYEEISNKFWSCVIFDEAHYIKAINIKGIPSSKRAKYAIDLSDNIEYVFLLTGTPMTARPKDLFNILTAIKHPIAKRRSDFYNYAHRYCGAVNKGYGWSYDGASNTDELHEEIKDSMIRRLKVDLLDLPEKTRDFIPVDVNLKKYKSAVLNYISKKSELNDMVEHLAFFNIMRHILAKTKIKATIELVNNVLENNEPIIIYTCFNIVVDTIMEHYGDRAVKFNGSCSNIEKQNAVDDFQRGAKDIFVANVLCGSEGITLTKSNQIIVNDFDWTPSNHAQCEDRIHRIGATQKCTIKYIYANGANVDEKMAEVLSTKLSNISSVIDGGNTDQESMINNIKNIFS